MKYLLDTDVLIDLSKGDVDVANFINSMNSINIASITASEFLYGARDKIEMNKLQKFIDVCNVINFDREISQLQIELIIKYKLKFNLHPTDALIAATAIKNNMVLFTKNKRHYRMIEELRIVGEGF